MMVLSCLWKEAVLWANKIGGQHGRSAMTAYPEVFLSRVNHGTGEACRGSPLWPFQTGHEAIVFLPIVSPLHRLRVAKPKMMKSVII